MQPLVRAALKADFLTVLSLWYGEYGAVSLVTILPRMRNVHVPSRGTFVASAANSSVKSVRVITANMLQFTVEKNFPLLRSSLLLLNKYTGPTPLP